MIDASSVTNPSLSGLAPRPTQQLVVDSVTITPASTASSADPLLPSTAHAPLFAANPVSHVEITTGCLATAASGPATPAGTLAIPFFPNKIPRALTKEDCKKNRLLSIYL